MEAREALIAEIVKTLERERCRTPGQFAGRRRQTAKWSGKEPALLSRVDEALCRVWEREELSSLWDLNCLIYAGAQVVTARGKGEPEEGEPEDSAEELEHQREEAEEDPWGFFELFEQPEPEADPTPGSGEPAQLKRAAANELRRYIGYLDAERERQKRSGKKKPTAREAHRRNLIFRRFGRVKLDPRGLAQLREKLLGLLKVKSLQARRHKQKEQLQTANAKLAETGPKKWSQQGAEQAVLSDSQVEELGTFWKGLWETEGQYSPTHPALLEWKKEVRAQAEATPEDGDPLDRDVAWARALKKQAGWKAPGPDCISAYWLRAFPSIVTFLKAAMWKVMDGASELPEWVVRGRTVMLPKEGCTGKPDQYRPITCLNTSYKLLTTTLAEVLMAHVTAKNLLPEEQKALRRGRRGCLDALTVDAAIAREAQVDKRDLSVAWIDYRKAYDMVPHRWIRGALKAIRAPKQVRRLVRRLVPLWQTNLTVRTAQGTTSIPVTLKRGVFQGDSLSPLLFCICIAPLSLRLRKRTGFRSAHQVSPVTHMFFMDDLKTYEEGKKPLEETVGLVEEVSGAIGMTLGLKKCAVSHARKGKVARGGSTTLPSGNALEEVEYGSSYKYLGVEQLMGAKLLHVRRRIKSEYLSRVKRVWKSKVNARSKVKLHNTWSAAVLRYFFGAVRWGKGDLRGMDRATRKIMRRCQNHRYGAALEKLYLPRSQGGRGLQSVELMWEREVASVGQYLGNSPDPQVQGTMRLQARLAHDGKYSYIAEAQQVLDRYDVGVTLAPLAAPEETVDDPQNPKGLANTIKAAQMDELEKKLLAKKIHGVHATQTRGPRVDQLATNAWLRDGLLKGQTEATIMAAQDGVIKTNAYKARIQRVDISPQCRLCERPETLGHILSSCKTYQWTLYKDRHDRVLYQLVKAVTKSLGLMLPKRLQGVGEWRRAE